LLRHRVRQRLIFQIFIPLQPLLKLNNFQRISGSGQGLGQERVRIKRNRRNERIQLIWRNCFSRRLLVSRTRHHLRLGLLGGRLYGWRRWRGLLSKHFTWS
jgi:hypothetical protein